MQYYDPKTKNPEELREILRQFARGLVIDWSRPLRVLVHKPLDISYSRDILPPTKIELDEIVYRMETWFVDGHYERYISANGVVVDRWRVDAKST